VDLREKVGDEVFFEALQSYYAENRFGVAPPQALLGSFEEACACSLDEFYAEWGVE
jgi:aminopeptidase N